MLDKVNRIQRTAAEVGLFLGVSKEVLQVIQEAASLAMSDLATAVVMEFTGLSGTMAHHYALRDGYSKEVREIIYIWFQMVFFLLVFLAIE